MRIHPHDDAYPQRLAGLSKKPVLTTSGPLEHHRVAVAIVGSRRPLEESERFTRRLAGMLAEAGVLVVSGGAVGIDTAAHEGAMDAGGATFCVAPNGRHRPYPEDNRALFERIAASERSRMIWPFEDGREKDKESPKERNRVLVALASAVVVVQARYASGSRNAAAHARRMARPLFIVPGPPWMAEFAGSLADLSEGRGLILTHESQLFVALGLPWRGEGRPHRPPVAQQPSLPIFDEPPEEPETDLWTDEERAVFSALSTRVQHVDDVVARSGLSASSTCTALLTLSLKDVVVEGPDGFYRRK